MNHFHEILKCSAKSKQTAYLPSLISSLTVVAGLFFWRALICCREACLGPAKRRGFVMSELREEDEEHIQEKRRGSF